MKKYEPLDVSGDVGLRIRGKTLQELFENAALGMSELITDTAKIKETEKKGFLLNAHDYEGLLVRWLNELIFLLDAFGFIGKSFSVNLEGNELRAEVSGGYFDPQGNEGRLLIKAATYHRLRIERKDNTWEAEVIFDI